MQRPTIHCPVGVRGLECGAPATSRPDVRRDPESGAFQILWDCTAGHTFSHVYR
jgi:hypothetical protein